MTSCFGGIFVLDVVFIGREKKRHTKKKENGNKMHKHFLIGDDEATVRMEINEVKGLS